MDNKIVGQVKLEARLLDIETFDETINQFYISSELNTYVLTEYKKRLRKYRSFGIRYKLMTSAPHDGLMIRVQKIIKE